MFGFGHALQYAPISLNLNALHFIPLSNTYITQQKRILHKVVFDVRLWSRFNYPARLYIYRLIKYSMEVLQKRVLQHLHILYIVCTENMRARNRV